VQELKGAPETGGRNFHVNAQEKLALIYDLQVHMELIAMVTGHVPHHHTNPAHLLLLPPFFLLAFHSHHSSEGDDTGVTAVVVYWRISPAEC